MSESPGPDEPVLQMSGISGEPDIAVVIVNFRTAHLTSEAVRSVLAAPEVLEVVVVDNASGDGSFEVLRAEFAGTRVKVIESAVNLGFGRGVNFGVAHSRAPLLFFLNSDAQLSFGSLAPLRSALVGDETIGVVAPAIFWADRSDLQPAHGVFPTFRSILFRTNHRPPETIWPDWVSGAAMLVRRRDFEALDGFDPDLSMYLEDVDLCRRMKDHGRRTRRELSASVFHALGQSWHDDAERMGWALESRVVYARKAGLPWKDQLAVRAIRSVHLVRHHCHHGIRQRRPAGNTHLEQR